MSTQVETTNSIVGANKSSIEAAANGPLVDDSTVSASVQPGGLMGDISSPHELTDWVDSVIDKLENRFGAMREQVDERMNEMSARIDALENSIQDVISGNLAHYSHSQPSSGPASSTATSTQQHKDGSED